MAEDDWDGWAALTGALGDRVQLVGDDVFVTNIELIERGIAQGVANAVLIKVNQIGTLTETLDAIELAARALPHRHLPPLRRDRGHHHRRPGRGGERRPDQGRCPLRSDRVAKYNQLLRIEEDLGGAAAYGGADALAARRDMARAAQARRPAAARSRAPGAATSALPMLVGGAAALAAVIVAAWFPAVSLFHQHQQLSASSSSSTSCAGRTPPCAPRRAAEEPGRGRPHRPAAVPTGRSGSAGLRGPAPGAPAGVRGDPGSSHR